MMNALVGIGSGGGKSGGSDKTKLILDRANELL
jgi:hypothetical protein